MISRLPYIIAVILLLVFSVFDYFLKNKKVKAFLFISFLFFYVLLLSLRSNTVGLDTQNYSNTYYSTRDLNYAKTLILKNKPEYLYYIIVTFFSGVLHLPELYFRLFYYSIIALLLFLTFRKLNNRLFYFSIFLFLGFFNMSFSGMRQSMSIAIMTFAICSLLFSEKQHKFLLVKYYILNIIAIGFHSSSILMLFIPVFLLLKLKKENFVFLLPLLFFIPDIIKKAVYFVSFYVYVYYGFTNLRVSITYILLLLLVIIYYLFVGCPFLSNFFKQKFKFIDFNKIKFDSRIIILIVCSLAFLSCNKYSAVITRYSMFFYFPVSIFIGYFFNCFNNKKLSVSSYCIILTVFGCYLLYSLPTMGLLPYSIL